MTRRGLTTSQAAELLGCSQQTAIRLMDAGSIRSWRIRGHRRAFLLDVLDYARDEEIPIPDEIMEKYCNGKRSA